MAISLTVGMAIAIIIQNAIRFINGGIVDWWSDVWSCMITALGGVTLALLVSFASGLAPRS